MTGDKQRTELVTVMVIDDDHDFRAVLTDVFTLANGFKVVGVFGSLEQFVASVPGDVHVAQNYLADLLVLDLFAAAAPGSGQNDADGVTVATTLRDAGLGFAALFVSSMTSHHFSLLGHHGGWEFVQKTSRLSAEVVLEHARRALLQTTVTQ